MVPDFDVRSQEGKQASLAADFSITQFRHLGRLLMVHGRNSYKRSAALSQFVIHRSLCISTMQVGGRARWGAAVESAGEAAGPALAVTPAEPVPVRHSAAPTPPTPKELLAPAWSPTVWGPSSCVGAEAVLALQSLNGGAWPGTRRAEVSVPWVRASG